MKDSKVFEPVGMIILSDGSNTADPQVRGGPGRSRWAQPLIDSLHRAVQRLEKMSLEQERLPRGWERGL